MPKIYCKDCEHFDKCVRGYMPDCPVYYPKKGIMTNEEWLEQASTEEKAKFLEMICYSAWGDKNSRFKDMADYTDWMDWLKEKHEE